MRVLAFSDLHASRSAADRILEASVDADLVVGAGDFCNMRSGLGPALAMLHGIAATQVFVPGNAESAEELRAAAPCGVHVLHGSGCDVDGLRVFGLGYGVPVTPFGDWSCDLSEIDAAEMLRHCHRADMLVLHSPPKGVADVTSAGQSVGSTAIRDAIARIKPRLAVCGHIHDSWGQEGRIGPTRVVNLGPRPNWFDLEIDA